ncbi:hypothetical protein K402DRAFT_396616, partial [Aulographum hederae CBS 113979]
AGRDRVSALGAASSREAQAQNLNLPPHHTVPSSRTRHTPLSDRSLCCRRFHLSITRSQTREDHPQSAHSNDQSETVAGSRGPPAQALQPSIEEQLQLEQLQAAREARQHATSHEAREHKLHEARMAQLQQPALDHQGTQKTQDDTLDLYGLTARRRPHK